MRIEEKRQVIEVLLCGRDEDGVRILNITDEVAVTNACYSEFEKARASLSDETLNLIRDEGSEYWHTATEAAYRLIESSPTLRREWFGR